jgi:hypothetical protein
LTAQGKELLKRAIPAWERAQRRATDVLDNEGIALLNKAVGTLGLPRNR